MSHTRGKDKANPGKFAFECIDWNGDPFRTQGGFVTAQEADRAAERAERDMMTAMATGPIITAIKPDMTDDELLAELMA